MNLTLEQIIEAAESGEYIGFCIACGAQVGGVEPDARRYPCDVCDELKVFGAEELLMMLSA